MITPARAKRRIKTVYTRGFRDGSVLGGDKEFLKPREMG
jgi:hypothetical protein